MKQRIFQGSATVTLLMLLSCVPAAMANSEVTVSTFSYDANGLLVGLDGRTDYTQTSLTYDVNGHLIREESSNAVADGGATATTVSDNGLLTTVTTSSSGQVYLRLP